jgi:hypothetical protein
VRVVIAGSQPQAQRLLRRVLGDAVETDERRIAGGER